MNMIAERSPQMRKAVGVLKELSADERTRMLYEAREMARMDTEARVSDGVRAVARKLLMRNRPIDEIIEDTGLTREEVELLRVAH